MNLCFCNGDQSGHGSSDPVVQSEPDEIFTAPVGPDGRFTVQLPRDDHDPVDHPVHYTSSPAMCECGRPIECIDVVQHMSFPVGAAVKYLWRLDLKGDAVADLRKAAKYIEFEIAKREALS